MDDNWRTPTPMGQADLAADLQHYKRLAQQNQETFESVLVDYTKCREKLIAAQERIKVLENTLDGQFQNEDHQFWISGDHPPMGEVGKWSKQVIVFTERGLIAKVHYFHGDHGGVWQRTSAMHEDDNVLWWTHIP